MLRHPFPLRDQPHGIVQNRVYSGHGKGVKRTVEAEKGRERESREVEAGHGHEHVERGGKEEPKRAREKQEGSNSKSDRGGGKQPLL